jgi:hypothetical protein
LAAIAGAAVKANAVQTAADLATESVFDFDMRIAFHSGSRLIIFVVLLIGRVDLLGFAMTGHHFSRSTRIPSVVSPDGWGIGKGKLARFEQCLAGNTCRTAK